MLINIAEARTRRTGAAPAAASPIRRASRIPAPPSLRPGGSLALTAAEALLQAVQVEDAAADASAAGASPPLSRAEALLGAARAVFDRERSGGTGGAALEVLNPVAAAYTSPRGGAAAPAAAPPLHVHVHNHAPPAADSSGAPMMTPVRTAEPPPLAVGSAGVDAATQSPVDPSPSPSASPAVWPEAAAWREAAAAAGCAPAATPLSPPLLPRAEAEWSVEPPQTSPYAGAAQRTAVYAMAAAAADAEAAEAEAAPATRVRWACAATLSWSRLLSRTVW